MQYPHLICDLKEGHEFNFTVPFTSGTAWRPTFIKRMFRNHKYYATGTISIFVLDGLRSPSGTTEILEGFITVRGGSDFEFSVMRNISNTNDYRQYNDAGVNPLSKVLWDDTMVQAGDFVLGNNNISKHISTFKEDFMNIHLLMSRYADCGFEIHTTARHGGVATGKQAEFNMAFIPVTPRFWFGDTQPTCTPLAFFSQFFTFWRGSLKFKLVVSTTNAQPTPNLAAQTFRIAHVPNRHLDEDPELLELYWNYAGMGQDSGLAGQTTQLLKENIIEFEVPYYSMYDSLFIRTRNMNRSHGFPILSSHNGCLKLQWNSKVTASYKLYIAAGSDFEYLVPNSIEELDGAQYAFGVTGSNKVPGDMDGAWTDQKSTGKPRFDHYVVPVNNPTP